LTANKSDAHILIEILTKVSYLKLQKIFMLEIDMSMKMAVRVCVRLVNVSEYILNGCFKINRLFF